MKTITREEIQKLIKEKQIFVLVDALRQDSFDKVHIPNSINLPIRLPDFNELALKLIPNKKQLIVTYCTGAG